MDGLIRVRHLGTSMENDLNLRLIMSKEAK
jgi:hypothetical protein